MASLFTLIKFTGEECDDSWRHGPMVISEQADTIQLPEFDTLDVSYGYNAGEGQDMSIYVRNGMHVRLSVDSIAKDPYALVPESFDDVNIKEDRGTLHMEFIFPKRFCEYDDSVSSPITIMLPVSMTGNLSRVRCKNED